MTLVFTFRCQVLCLFVYSNFIPESSWIFRIWKRHLSPFSSKIHKCVEKIWNSKHKNIKGCLSLSMEYAVVSSIVNRTKLNCVSIELNSWIEFDCIQ